LYDYFKSKGSFIAPFAGWEMPVYITSIKEEHLAVRKSCGVFDVSHMGMINLIGENALKFIDYIVTNNISASQKYKAIYSPVCNESGGILDDIIVYKRSSNSITLIVNASNVEKILNHLNNQNKNYNVKISQVNILGLAIQGPESKNIMRQFSKDIEKLSYYSFTETKFNNKDFFVGRTGYTGELGYEIFCDVSNDKNIFDSVINFFEKESVMFCGLGSRDSLRIEAGYPLYSHELSEDVDPISAGISWAVKFEKENFIGKSALEKMKKDGVKNKLVGLEFSDKIIPRAGYEIFYDGKKIGYITSGTFSFTLDKPIAMAYVDKAYSENNNLLDIIVRGKVVKAKVVSKTFYSNPNIKI